MRFLIQRVKKAKVLVDNVVSGEIKRGLLVFVGISNDDNEETALKMLKKLFNLRIFEDENGKTNLSLSDVNASILLVSQFTLYADVSHGNRPSFINARKPDEAKVLFEFFVSKAKESDFDIQTGIFGADMKVELINDGPFTIILDSKEL